MAASPGLIPTRMPAAAGRGRRPQRGPVSEALAAPLEPTNHLHAPHPSIGEASDRQPPAVRLSELTPAQRQLVLALVAADPGSVAPSTSDQRTNCAAGASRSARHQARDGSA